MIFKVSLYKFTPCPFISKKLSTVRKRILIQPNRFPLYGHHIESNRHLNAVAIFPQIIRCAIGDPHLFFVVHSIGRISTVWPAAIFHFHKYQIVSIPGDQVDLAQPAPEIVFQYLIALCFQIVCCKLLICSANLSGIPLLVILFLTICIQRCLLYRCSVRYKIPFCQNRFIAVSFILLI